MLILALGFVSCNNKTNHKQGLENWVKNYIKENGDEDSETTYTFSKVELNNETITYLVNIEGEYWCGTGGCPVLLVGKNNGIFKLINNFSPIQEIKVSEKVVNGWKELHIVIGDGGSSENQTYVYDSKSKLYQLVE